MYCDEVKLTQEKSHYDEESRYCCRRDCHSRRELFVMPVPEPSRPARCGAEWEARERGFCRGKARPSWASTQQSGDEDPKENTIGRQIGEEAGCGVEREASRERRRGEGASMGADAWTGPTQALGRHAPDNGAHAESIGGRRRRARGATGTRVPERQIVKHPCRYSR